MKKTSVFKVIKTLTPVIFKAAPLILIMNIIISVSHGMSWGLVTVMQQRLFDVSAKLAGSSAVYTDVIIVLVYLGLATALCQILNGADNLIPDVLRPKIEGILSVGIHQKMSRLSPVLFEDTDKLDAINKAEQGKNNAVKFIFSIKSITFFYVPYFIFIGWYLFTLKPVLALSVLLIFFPTAASQFVRTKYFAKLEDKSAPFRRECEYYESCITSREYFKETRLLGGFKYFRDKCLNTLDMLQKLRFKAMMKSNIIELIMDLTSVAGYFGILFMLFNALMKQDITVGAFAALFNSISTLYGLMEEVVCWHVGEMAENTGSVKNYVDFLEMEERKTSINTIPEWGDITLENVNFSYPKAERCAVNNVSLTLKKGETLAIVGENGSGKSTLIRLISGLYFPESGSVKVNGTETKELTANALFANTSGVFQKYQRYQMTLQDNITISNVDETSNNETLDSICEMAGTNKDDSTFTDGYDTMLSREFDGIDLSGGQWQRVAIARGFFRTHNVIILDEPTAAIDPYEETRIYNRFAEISKDKSAIIVTHRLGSVKLADRIIVMKDGELTQCGTHEELIAVEGEYKRLYETQEQWYKETITAV